jgi:hypothetical protein
MKKLLSLLFVTLLSLSGVLSATVIAHTNLTQTPSTTGTYVQQWMHEYGTSAWTDARFQGPQPIGDADNDGKNELLISGRDCTLRVMEYDQSKQNYTQVQAIHPPGWPVKRCDAGGMAVGDVTNDGKNEIAATWYDVIYSYKLGRFWPIGINPWIFWHNGASGDCLIGDCDNDGKNELIVSGGSSWGQGQGPVGEITVLKWSGHLLKRYAAWNDTVSGYVYMAGLGDLDGDGENEIACAYAQKLVVLNWNKGTKTFEPTVVARYHSNMIPFGCVCKDCDGDSKAELLLSYENPRISIYKWNGTGYATQFDINWTDGDPVIEGIDAGDTDGDGMPEVCAGAGVTHVMQWNGTTYVEEATLPTFGWMAVVCIGDCDNDGKNEINCGNVDVPDGMQYTEWIYKYQP